MFKGLSVRSVRINLVGFTDDSKNHLGIGNLVLRSKLTLQNEKRFIIKNLGYNTITEVKRQFKCTTVLPHTFIALCLLQ